MQREVAQALDESALVASEPVTVVLSQKGWIRAGKGHESTPKALNYRDGDGLLAASCAHAPPSRSRSSTPPAAAIPPPAHTLPSARGNGEPLTGRFSPPAGASSTRWPPATTTPG